MNVAWFRPAPRPADPDLDETAGLGAELGRRPEIALFDKTRAHEFVWTHARRQYDLCVYELANTPAHTFVWPYLLHFPGLLRLRGPSMHESRMLVLSRSRRREEYAAEYAFGGWDMVRGRLLASKLVVAVDERTADCLRHDHPGVVIRHAPVGIPAPERSRIRTAEGGPVTFGAVRPSLSFERAARRARAAGAPVRARSTGPVAELLRDCDVLVSLDWTPSDGDIPTDALVAMAAAKPVILLETEATAVLPALDPQTWQPRDPGGPPIVISLDPRDEEHSLVLAMKRLAGDASLRLQLGEGAAAWWAAHATLDRAVAARHPILDEAARLTPPQRPREWPPHLDADGTARARTILGEFGLAVDVVG